MLTSVEIQSVHLHLPQNSSASSSSIFPAFFTPSPISHCYDLTLLGQTCFNFARFFSSPSSTNETKIHVPPLFEFKPGTVRISNLAPKNGNVLTQRSKITVEFGDANVASRQGETSSNLNESILIIISRVQSSCPWLSSFTKATLEDFFKIVTTTTSSDHHPNSIKFHSALPRGLVISGPPQSGKKSLAVSIGNSLSSSSSCSSKESTEVITLDCSSLAQLCLLHGSDFNFQVAIRSVIDKWFQQNQNGKSWSCLILYRMDFFDLGGAVREKSGSSGGNDESSSHQQGKSLPSSIPENARRIFWLEFTSAFRRAKNNNSKMIWIATSSNESLLGRISNSASAMTSINNNSSNNSDESFTMMNQTSVFSRWVAFSIDLPESPEFSQRQAIVTTSKILITSDNLLVDEKKVLKECIIATHGWSIGKLYKTLSKNSTLQNLQSAILTENNNNSNSDSSFSATTTKVFGMDEDLTVIQDSCITPLCRVAKELKEGTRSFITTTEDTNINNTAGKSNSNHIFLPKGILIVGPSGCGKSHLLKHLSEKITHGSAGGVAVILQDTLSLVQKEVGATELNIHNLFERARASAPCVLLLDHIDSIAPPRNSSMFSDSSSHVADRMLSTLLIEMDGVKKSERDKYVIVVATASNLEALDPAVRRPGRLDIHIEVKVPTEKAVFEMLMDGLQPTFEKFIMNSEEDNDKKTMMMMMIRDAVEQKAKELLIPVEEPNPECFVSYADIRAWYREKVSKLVSKWLLLKKEEGESAAVISFDRIEDWLEWMHDEKL